MMKIIGLLVTLALMQMSCFADGFYFCFKPACTKTYLKFNQSQMVSHLVKNHKAKKVSSNRVSMPNFRTIDITPNTSYDNDYAQNNWFNYADNKKIMEAFIITWKSEAKAISGFKPKEQNEPLIVMSNMRHCNKCNQEVPVRFFDAHDIDHQRSEMNQYNRRRF